MLRLPLLSRGFRASVCSRFVFFTRQRNASSISVEEDDGLQLDYPKLPFKSVQLNEPLGWWDNQDRRDKETILHEEDDVLNMWMYDEVECGGKYTKWQALGHLLTAFGLLGLVSYLSVLYDAPSRNPAAPKEYPFNQLHLERGGDPSAQPQLTEHVHVTYGGSI
ncbi:NADH dehydrogenase [ubiquinone] 1 beta subcomplex subunit 8, mitochondrial-like [Corticium candelabrum]|uniref:NADH dehydrogenase [ubiquinone] 1 beta subcomplex subunit 8, mitochondrial-like n=1 Tax=Corticium candelabrum TaxID=121492 RepID=UPI002E255209|nr:NADH dehydrogenase [ubiquinone] 1 beta subcomplex subunit 8, mitochondrial-like [Corticium candelabrum]